MLDKEKNSETWQNKHTDTHTLTHEADRAVVYIKNNQIDWMGVARVFGSPSLYPIHPQAIHDFHIFIEYGFASIAEK